MSGIKKVAVASLVAMSTLSMVACQKPVEDVKIEKDIQGTGIGEYRGDIEVTPGGNTQAPTEKQRTVIENGVVKVWAETFDQDKTIKPTAIKYEEDGSGNHTIYYEVNGQKLEVRVAGDTGDRYFCEDGKYRNFARIGKSVTKSNEAVLASIAANDRLNEEVAKKYK